MSSTTISRRSLQDHTSYGQRSGVSSKKAGGTSRLPFASRYNPYPKKPSSDQYTHAHRNTSKHFPRGKSSYESVPLLTRLNSTPSSPTSTLLERIGAQAEVEEEGAINSEDDFSMVHSDTPEPGELEWKPVVVEPDEVERFLESVIGPPPLRVPDLSPSANKTLASDRLSEDSDECPPGLKYIKQETRTHSLPPHFAAESEHVPNTHFSRSGPVQTPRHHDHVGFTAPRPSTSVLEQCREHLAPVVQAAQKARDPSQHPLENTAHVQPCTTLRLSDDQCAVLLRLAKDMRAQLDHPSARERLGRYGRELDGSWDRRDDLRSQPDHPTPWNCRDLPIRHNSVDGAATPLWGDSDMTLVDVPRDDTSIFCALEKNYDSLSMNEVSLMSPTTNIFNAGNTNHSESIVEGADQEGTATPACSSPVANVQRLTVPGIWSKHTGADMPDVHDIEIIVDDDLFSSETKRINAIARIYCLRKDKKMPEIDHGESTSKVLTSIQASTSQWPRKGTLIIQVNPELSQGKTWLPYALGLAPFLDVTSCISPGKNVFRCISLSNLSDFTFILCVFPPPPEEAMWRNYDWQSTLLSSSTHASGNMDALSAFADLAAAA